MLISTKYEEIYPPEMKELLNISENKFKKDEILRMEYKILSTLEFNFMSPSSLRFLERYNFLPFLVDSNCFYRFRKLSTTASDDQIFYFA